MSLAIENSIVNLIGHPAPFSDEEYESVTGPLILEQINDLSPLRWLSRLAHLEIYTSELDSLDVLKDLKELKILKIICTDIRDIDALKECPFIESLHLSFTLIQDISPLFCLPFLKEVDLTGTPLREEQFDRVVPELKEWLPEKALRPPKVRVSDEDSWELTRFMFDRHINGCFSYREEQEEHVLVKPGKPRLTDSSCDAITANVTAVNMKISKGMSLREIFEDLRKYDREWRELSYFQLSHQPKRNDAEALLARIRSRFLPDEAKEPFITMLRNFPSLSYGWWSDKDIAFLEKQGGIRIPEWLKDIMQACGDILPGKFSKVRFKNFEYDSSYEEDLPNHWYFLRYSLTFCSSHDFFYCGGQKLLIVANEAETSRSVLALDIANPDDLSVYEFDLEDVSEEGVIETRDLNLVFDDFVDLFACIQAVQTEDGIIEAG